MTADFSDEAADGFDSHVDLSRGSEGRQRSERREQWRLRKRAMEQRWAAQDAARAAIDARLAADPDCWWPKTGDPCTHMGPGSPTGPARVLGQWLPNVYDETATCYRFVPYEVQGESADERTARLEAAFLKTPAMRRTQRDLELFKALNADDDKTSVAALFCSSANRRGEQCRRKLASLYRVGRTYVVTDVRYYTFPEARIQHLNIALAAREKGVEWLANLSEASAEVKVWGPRRWTLDPLSKDDPSRGGGGALPFDFLLIGCQHHGNAVFSYAWLRDLGKRGGHVAADVASQRLWALSCELSTEG